MVNYLEEFQRKKEILIRNKNRLQENLQKAIDKYEEIEKSNVDKKSKD